MTGDTLAEGGGNAARPRKKRQTYYPSGGFPKRLHTLMLKKALTQIAFTHRINNVKDEATETYGRHRVNAWLRGTNMPNRVALADIAKVLDVAEAELLDEKDAVLVGGAANDMKEESIRQSDGRVRYYFSGFLSAEKHLKVLAIIHGKDD